jgi:ferredoxin-NADP reductase
MIRHRVAAGGDVAVRLLYSSRSVDDVIYREELDGLASAGPGVEVVHTLTRTSPRGWEGRTGRIDGELLAELAWPAAARPLAYVCGPTRLVETVAKGLVGLGYEPARIRTERFGPTGG